MTTPDKDPAVQKRYDQLAQIFLRRQGLTREGSGFGAGALKLGGRMFAGISTNG